MNNDPNNNSNANSDAVAARRAALAQALRDGAPVSVGASGNVQFAEEANASGQPGIQVPDGKLAMEEF